MVNLGSSGAPPAINKRRADTLVLLNEGERLVIGGVTQTVNQTTIRKVPYLGLCLGLQCAVIEFAREVIKTGDANSTEFDMFTENPVIDFMPDQRDMEDKGGTMRLGLYPARLTAGSKAAAVYGQEVIYERHRHRFEVNNQYRQTLEDAVRKARSDRAALAAQGVHAKVLLVGMRLPPNYGAAYTNEFEANYRDLAERFHTALLPFLLAPIARDPTAFQADNMHPVARVQPLLRDHVWTALGPLLD